VNKTEWFPAYIRPVRAGLYEVERPCMSGTPWKSCKMLWTGKRWEYPNGLYSDFGRPYENGNKWRGLAEKSK
jgi:hypothetical protein